MRRHVITRGDAGEEKPFASAVEHQHFGNRIDPARQPVTAIQPLPNRDGELVEPAIHRVAAELADMGGDYRTDKRRDRMLRLADGKTDGRLSRWRIGQKLA